MIGVDLEALALLAVGAFVLALPAECLRHRNRWGIGMRLIAGNVGAAIIGAPLLMLGAYPGLDASPDEMCVQSRYDEWMRSCARVKQQFYVWLLPILVLLLLVLWSVFYAIVSTACRLVYRHLVRRQRVTP